MTMTNLGQWSYELAREHQQRLMQEAARQRQLKALRLVTKSASRRLQPLALLRTWRLVAPRLQLTGPADEAPCS